VGNNVKDEVYRGREGRNPPGDRTLSKRELEQYDILLEGIESRCYLEKIKRAQGGRVGFGYP
jgi:hypothetical protein